MTAIPNPAVEILAFAETPVQPKRIYSYIYLKKIYGMYYSKPHTGLRDNFLLPFGILAIFLECMIAQRVLRHVRF
jgi:hypothetical protein